MPPRKVFSYPFPRPAVTVDVAMFAADGTGAMRVLLIRRGKSPHAGSWALPGGFVDEHEDLPAAARRELEEETGIGAATGRWRLGPQLGAYGTPGRDPRGHTVGVAYLAWMREELCVVEGHDDAMDARWWSSRRPPKLAFDHRQILRDAVDRLGSYAAPRAIREEILDLLPREFDVRDAAELLAAARGVDLEPGLRAAALRFLRRSPRIREVRSTAREFRFRKI